MKNRRTVLLAFLLIASLCIGIGYARVSSNLTISGTATTAVAPINVKFTAASISSAATELPTGAEAHQNAIIAASSVGTPGDATISLTAAGLTYVNDSVTAIYTITNYNDYAVNVAAPTVSNLTDFEVTITGWADGEQPAAVNNNTITLAENETETFQVTVKLLTGSANKLTETFTITFNAYAGDDTATGSNGGQDAGDQSNA